MNGWSVHSLRWLPNHCTPACRLKRYLSELGEEKTCIVFANTKKTADGLARQIDKAGFNATVLHGGKTQEQREVRVRPWREDPGAERGESEAVEGRPRSRER